jgi:FMN-dependent NADH-azoreductase
VHRNHKLLTHEQDDVSLKCGETKVTLLDIQSSPRGESSDSIALTTSFIEACNSSNTSMVATLNVWHEQLPEYAWNRDHHELVVSLAKGKAALQTTGCVAT